MSTEENPHVNLEQLAIQVAPAHISVFAWQQLLDKFAIATERIAELEERENVLIARLDAQERRLKSIEVQLTRQQNGPT